MRTIYELSLLKNMQGAFTNAPKEYNYDNFSIQFSAKERTSADGGL